MDERDLRETVEKYGYKLVKVTRFKTHDRIKVETPDGELHITVNLRKHLEDTSRESILRCILTRDELIKEGIKEVE